MPRRLFISAIVAIALGGPIVEMFDRWDQTLQDGNDTETDVVVVALCIGVAFAIGTIIIGGRIRALSLRCAGPVVAKRFALRHVASILLVPVPTSSPPAVLRV